MDRKIATLRIKDRMYRRRFLVPNAVTLGSMFCGYLTVIYAASDRFEKAIVALGIAIFLDGVDGRVARRLQATSKFGLEFDSLSDFLSFGVAPAVLMYYWGYRQLADEFGVFVSFLYVLCAASRLARFNIQAENLKSFTGLPTPAAAWMVGAVINFVPRHDPSFAVTVFGLGLMASLAALMVSKIEFFSIKKLRLTGGYLFILLGAVIALLWYSSQIGFLVLISFYVLTGPIRAALRALGFIKRPPPVAVESVVQKIG